MKTFTASLFLCACAVFAGCHHHDSARRNRMPAPVIGLEAAPAPATVAIAASPDVAPPEPSPGTAQRTIGANDADDYYLSLMTPDERDILRARAVQSGRTQYQLTDFLTAEERDNLRRRQANHR